MIKIVQSVENSYFYPPEDLDLDYAVQERICFKILWFFKVPPTLYFIIFNVWDFA